MVPKDAYSPRQISRIGLNNARCVPFHFEGVGFHESDLTADVLINGNATGKSRAECMTSFYSSAISKNLVSRSNNPRSPSASIDIDRSHYTF